jgi:putative membrane-bound dehydrogenase-like protein
MAIRSEIDTMQKTSVSALFLVVIALGAFAPAARGAAATDLRVGAWAVNLKCDPSMVLAGMIEARYTDQQEGQLRAVAVVIEKPGSGKIAIVACDVLWIPRPLVDAALAKIEAATGIPPQSVLVNATHTHHAPSTAPAHDFGVSEKFCKELGRGIVRAVTEANQRLAGGDAAFFYALGEEKTVGANSRLKLPGNNITWLNPAREAGDSPVPTGPFDPQLPLLDFRDVAGKSRALIFNHSTHTIGTRSGKNVRSPSFYGLAAQELEPELGATVSFLEGASGSTHNITLVPVADAVVRMKKAVKDARAKAVRHPVDQLAALRRPLKFRVRHFDDSEEDAKIARYTTRYAPAASDRIRQVFAAMRRKLKDQQGQERETYVQVLRIGDVAIVGVPAEYFTGLGLDIKQRSPFRNTVVAELANDWIGYLPDREGHRLGGYQTWMGLHSYAEAGTGERVADLAVELLKELSNRIAQKPSGSLGRAPLLPSRSNSETAQKPDQWEVHPPENTTRAGLGRKSPDEERRTFQLADPHLTIEPVAAEPEVTSPVAFAWDADGRLYVAEMGGYPVTQHQGRIKQLRDTNGDGRFDQSIVFADDLGFPATVMPYRDGLLTIDAPDLLFLRDTNGDGKADERRVVLTGFVPGSQQLRANALHWGLDNWIYGANGRCDGEIREPGAPASTAVSIRGRDFRFRLPAPNSRSPVVFEAIAGQSQFGQCHDDWGHRFLSWNVIPIREAVIPEPHATRRPQLLARAVADIAPEDDSGRVFPISPPPRQFNAERADYYNAMCGLTIFRGDALGPAYCGNAFVCESLSNLVTRRILKPRGIPFLSERAENGREFLASTDSWFHPVFLATGPDGALYVADFYREYVEHPIYVASEEIRKRIPWGHGAQNGRLWRIHHKDSKPAAEARRPRLARASTAELVSALGHPVGWWRDTAQRLLVERQDRAAAPLLEKTVRDSPSSIAIIHALWSLDGLDAANPSILASALDSADPRVREQAVAVIDARPTRIGKLIPQLLELVDDPDRTVRFRLALALSACSADEVRLHALVQLAERADNDSWILAGLLGSATGQTSGVIELLSSTNRKILSNANPAFLQFLSDAGEQIAGELDDESAADFAGGMANTIRQERRASGALVLLAGLKQGRERLRGSGNGQLAFPSEPQRSRVVELATAVVADAGQPAIIRSAAARLVPLAKSAQSVAELVPLLEDPAAADIRTAVAEVLADSGDSATCRSLYEGWERLNAETRRAILGSASRSEIAIAALLQAIREDVVRTVEIPIDIIERLKHSGTPAMQQQVLVVFTSRVSGDRAAVINRYRESLTRAGDVLRGATVFRENCLTCHTIQRFGHQVGPELSGLSSRSKEILLHDILDPSVQISTDFLSYVVLTSDGKMTDGLIAAQTPQSVRLRRAQGEEVVIPAERIEQLRVNKKSLMPEGFETKIGVPAMADLLAFLRQPGRELLEPRTPGSDSRPQYRNAGRP